MNSRTLRSRVLTLAGVGVLAASAALSMLSRQSLLALERSVHDEQARVAAVAAAVLARDLVSDLETLQGAVSAPQVQESGSGLDAWHHQLTASSRELRLADGVCYADVNALPLACAPGDIVSRLAHPQLAAAVRSAIATRRPVVSRFVAQADGSSDAVAVVPFVPEGRPGGATIALIAGDGARMRALLPATGETLLSLREGSAAGASGDPPQASVPGAPWAVHVLTPTGGRDTVLTFRRRSLWFAPSVAALAMLMAWGVALSVQRPLQALTRSAERIAGGDLSGPIAQGPDEIGRLGAALENMRVRLKASIDASGRANADLERRVEERTSQLQRLLGKVISAQEDERRRVARELHDETSQVLTGLGMALQAGAATGGPQRADELKALVDRMHVGLHRLITNLRPAVLDDLGLAAAIEGLVDAQLRRAGFASVHCELAEIEDLRADPSVEIALFRVVQESILNIVRHSSATSVFVEAGLDQGRLSIDIEDDGSGFDPSAVQPDTSTLRGVGLAGMRERMELIGGQLKIDSAPGQGTHVHLEAPVRAAVRTAAV